MTERRPVYHADLAGLAAERRRALLYAALNDAGAAERAFLALVAEIARQRDLLSLGTLDDAALAVLWAGGIADEPPATAAERKFWPGDVVEDDGEYHD